MGIGIGNATLLAIILYAILHPWLMLWVEHLFKDKEED